MGYTVINEDETLVNSIKKRDSIYKCVNTFMLTMIIVFQIFCFIYLFEISKLAKEIDLYTLNQTETKEYITKLETIINYICDNEGIC